MIRVYAIIIILCLLFGCAENTGDISIPNIEPEALPSTVRTVRVASGYPAESPVGIFVEKFATELEALLNVEVLVYHDGFIGDDERMKQLLADGGLDYAVISFEEDDILNEIISTPFLFNEDNIDSFIEELNEENPAQTPYPVLSYLNCGSIGLQSQERFLVTEELLSELSNEEMLTVFPTNINDDNFSMNYLANIDYMYDIMMLCESKQGTIMFDEYQQTRQAAATALQSMSEVEHAVTNPSTLFYIPSDYNEYIESLPPAAERLLEIAGENDPRVTSIVDNVLS